MNNEIRQSVLVVTYNQEEYIDECIMSVLNQTELPFEIVFSDDCSTDKTWEIILSYQQKYPKLIKAFRNNPNLGVFENLRKIRTYASGNIINFLAGDDLYKPKTLETISKAIIDNGLNPNNGKFIIALNSIHLYPDGRETIWRNYTERDKNVVSLRLRYGLSYRSIGLSKELIRVVRSESEVLESNPSFGYGADWIKGFEEVQKAEKIVFVDYSGPVYRLGSGITSKEKYIDSIKSNLNLVNFIENEYESFWDKKDLLHINYLRFRNEYILDKSLKKFILAFYYWVLNFNNFSKNFPWIREFKTFLPEQLIPFFKYKFYPIFQKLRGRENSR